MDKAFAAAIRQRFWDFNARFQTMTRLYFRLYCVSEIQNTKSTPFPSYILYVIIVVKEGPAATINQKQGNYINFLCTLLNTDSSAGPKIPMCRRMLGSNSGLLRLWH